VTHPLEEAFVKISPWFKTFGTEFKRGVESGLREGNVAVRHGTEQMGKNFEQVNKSSNAAFREVSTGAKRTAEESSGHFRRLGSGITGSLGGMRRGFAGLFSFAALGFATLGAIGAGVAVKGFVEAAREQQKTLAQTNAVLRSTGGAAHVTAQGVEALSTALSKQTGIEDDVISGNQNLLLTFTNVRNEVGKGNDIFTHATKAVLDMSVALKEDGKSASIQLGKALNDPIKGITALSRVGVTFSADQKKVIKSLVDTGHTLDAQKIILKELDREFGGSAAAQATAGDKMKAAWKEVQETIGRKLLPVLDAVENWFTKTGLPAINRGIDVASKWIKDHWGSISTVFMTVWTGIKWVFAQIGTGFSWFVDHIVKPTIDYIRDHWPDIKRIISETVAVVKIIIRDLGIAILWVKDHIIIPLIDWIRAHWPEIAKTFKTVWEQLKPTIMALWKLIEQLWKSIIMPLVQWIKDHWPQIATIFKIVIAAVLVVLFVLNKALQLLATVLTWLVKNIIGPMMALMRNVITGAIGAIIAIWNGLKAAWNATFNFITTIGEKVVNWFQHLPGRIAAIFSSAINLLVSAGKAIIQGLWNGIQSLATWFINLVKGIPGWVKNALSDAASWLLDVGKNIVHGLWNGITSLGSWLIKQVTDLIPGWIKSALKIFSIPQWAVDLGIWIAKGLAHGITKLPGFMANLAKSALGALAKLAKSIGGGFVPGQPGSSVSPNQIAEHAYAFGLFPSMGWGPEQQQALIDLWNGESNWNPQAYNAASGATGIPQALPGNKMASAGADWQTNPATQIRWGLGYIKDRYGTPSEAYAQWLGRNPHWYEKGAWEIPYDQLAFLHRKEMVIPAKPAEAIRQRAGEGTSLQVTLERLLSRLEHLALSAQTQKIVVQIDGRAVASMVTKHQALNDRKGARQ
jgi:phage-related protein